MPFVQAIDCAREERIGRHGVSAAALNDALARAREALARLRARHADGTLPLLAVPAERGDLAAIQTAAERLRHGATDVVFLGTGGSSLGGQTLVQLSGRGVPGIGAFQAPPRIHFMDNLDPRTFGEFLERVPLPTTRFAAVSKSGGTAETLMQTIAVLSALKEAGLSARVPDLVLGLTEPAKAGKRNSLRELLAAHGVTMLDHHTGVGGRFSVLTNVGLLPAAVAGLDIAAVRAGAALVLAPVLEDGHVEAIPSAVGAALSVALATAKPINVLMAYADRLERLTRWWVQLWAESLGKDGKGTTPVGALGPVDQHSQLQLFIAGTRDKLFTVLTVGTAGAGPRMDTALAEKAGEPGLGGKTIGDLVDAQGRATAETLARNGCPVRTMHVERLDELALGALLMHFMLETMIAAHLLGVDAFDQPAVEEGKILAKRYLAGET
jgi:glucose-6-phosphate isomerase